MPDQPISATFDGIVIGTGQAGPSIADRFDDEGLKVAVIERKLFGGTCVNAGCVPTKTLVASARAAHMARRAADFGVVLDAPVRVDMKQVKARKDAIVARSNSGLTGWMQSFDNGTVFEGHGRLEGPNLVRVGDKLLQADKIFLNVGARAVVPPIPGLDQVDHFTNSTIMDVDFIPDHLLIIGGSYIALEFAQMYRRFGSQVSVIERGPMLLAREDEDISIAIRDILEKEGIAIYCGSTADSISKTADGLAVELTTPSGPETVSGSHLLMAVGRRPNTDDLGAEAAGLQLDDRGFITVDDQLRTNVPGIWAIGDCNGLAAFTHTSYNEFRNRRR